MDFSITQCVNELLRALIFSCYLFPTSSFQGFLSGKSVFFLLLLVPGYWSQYFCLHILLTKTTKEASPALVTLQVRWNKGKPLCRSLRELEGSKHKTQFFENWAHYCPLLHQQPETCVGCHLMAATNLVSGRWWAGNLNCHCALTQCSSSFLSLAFPSLL